MPEQAKAGHIGHGLNTVKGGKALTRTVELTHQIPCHTGVFSAQLLLFFCGGKDANAQRLGQKQLGACLGLIVALELAFQHMAGHRQAKDRLRCIDRMPPGQRHTRLGAHLACPGQNFASHGSGQQIDRPAENRDGHQRRAAHGVDVADGVGRSDTAKVEGVIDNRHKKVGSADNALLVVQTEYCRVVAARIAHPELLKGRARLTHREHLIEHARRNLAATTGAVAVFGQTYGLGHARLREGYIESRILADTHHSSVLATLELIQRIAGYHAAQLDQLRGAIELEEPAQALGYIEHHVWRIASNLVLGKRGLHRLK